LDLWNEVFVEWGIMLNRSDLRLSRLHQVFWMDWRLMLCHIHDHLLVHIDDYIPWLFEYEVQGLG
jgi:hypothetical protein